MNRKCFVGLTKGRGVYVSYYVLYGPINAQRVTICHFILLFNA